MKTRQTILAVFTAAAIGTALAPSAFAQPPPNPTQQPSVAQQGEVPLFRVTVVGHTTPAINYRPRRGDTKIDFAGTALLPTATGSATVSGEQGYIKISARFGKLVSATMFGPEYLTYVLWAITPEGRAKNLGEIQVDRNDGDAKVSVTTELQAFGMIVTAEPYFSVTQPSDAVVMQNVVRATTTGTVEVIEAKHELLKRGAYLMNQDASRLNIKPLEPGAPLDLAEARNAVALARIAGADRFATETFDKAARLLVDAEDARTRRLGSNAIMMPARQAAQTAEDARLVSLQHQEDAYQAELRAASIARERESQDRAQAEQARRQQAERVARDATAAQGVAERGRASADAAAASAEAARLDANAARVRAEAGRATAEAQTTQAQAATDAARSAAETQARQAQIAADVARTAAETQARQAQTAADVARTASEAQARQAQTDADAARTAAETQARQAQTAADAARTAAEAQTTQARLASERSDQEKIALRDRLREQLNVVLETRETARGLVVNLSDVLFDTGSADLKPGAREKLARISGILVTHPDLRLVVEGHTDSVGATDNNQQLSERRAESVRTYLVGQKIVAASVGTAGFGESQPVATNGTAAGRHLNRRVELVVSGDVIGRR